MKQRFAGILWVRELLNDVQESLLTLLVVLNGTGFLCRLYLHNWGGYPLDGLLHRWELHAVCLALLAFLDWRRRGWRRITRGIALGCSWVIMRTLHVVTEIPVAWEAISGNTTVTSFVCAEEGLFTVSMHGVSFTLMS